MFLGNVYVLDERQRKKRKETRANGGQSEEKEVLASGAAYHSESGQSPFLEKQRTRLNADTFFVLHSQPRLWRQLVNQEDCFPIKDVFSRHTFNLS